MDLGSIFLILAILLLVGVYITRPFTDEDAGNTSESSQKDVQSRESALLAERDRILNAIQELDFDNVLGKIPAGEYEIQRANLIASGVKILQDLDSFQPEEINQPIEDRIEAVIAAGRMAGTSSDLKPIPQSIPTAVNDVDPLEEMIAQRRQEHKETAGGFCPQCGKPIQKGDRFCSKCGSSL